MMITMPRKLTPRDFFKAAQNPSQWYLSARRLADAAEIILKDQSSREIPYFQAVDEAGKKALAIAITAKDKSGVADIKAEAPNYLSAQLLYAFALENVLKGLMVNRSPGLVDINRVSRLLTKHELVPLAQQAGMIIHPQELPVLKALSHIATWAGRYPVATQFDTYSNPDNPYPHGVDPESLLDYGSAHPVMRSFFERAMEKLRKAIGGEPSRFGSVVSFAPVT
jgi:hypothetical protein